MAVISGAKIGAAHDGAAELVLSLKYENGGVSEVTLDPVASNALMDSCDAKDIDGLIGHSWMKVRDALKVSYNRFNQEG